MILTATGIVIGVVHAVAFYTWSEVLVGVTNQVANNMWLSIAWVFSSLLWDFIPRPRGTIIR